MLGLGGLAASAAIGSGATDPSTSGPLAAARSAVDQRLRSTLGRLDQAAARGVDSGWSPDPARIRVDRGLSVPVLRKLSPVLFEDVRLNWIWDEARSPREADPHATLEVSLTADGRPVFEESHPANVLAWNEWLPELDDRAHVLASYIQPNLPSLAGVLKAAGTHLRQARGSDALCGYQMDDPAWVESMVGAVHLALAQDSGVSYINPPSSFEQGQKILLSGDVLAQGMGSCLDLTLLQCGLLERIGLNPVVIVVRGHAFPAVWTRPDGAIEHPSELVDALGAGLLPFNSTTFCEGGSFDDARQAARGILESTPLLVCVDVRLARERGVRPLL